MGYSVITVFPNKESRDYMWKFLKKNYREWPDVVDANFLTQKKRASYISHPTKSPAYGRKRLVIAFDYNAGDLEREYAWHICRWMAEKIGVDFVQHDCDKIPLDKVILEFMLTMYPKGTKIYREMIEEANLLAQEIFRLDQLWSEYHG